MGNALSPAGPKAYGGLQPSGSIGADEFAAHDSSKMWDDGGASEAVVNHMADQLMGLVPEVAAFGAEQAKQAVLEYMQAAYGEFTVVQGELVFLIDSSNNAASFGVFYKSADRLLQAIGEAETAGDEEFLRVVGGFLEKVTRRFQAVQGIAAAPLPAPARALREGNARPAAVGRGERGRGRAADPAAIPPPPPAVPSAVPRPARGPRPGAAHNARVSATPPRQAS